MPLAMEVDVPRLLASLRILLVDDDDRVRRSVARALVRRGCQVVEADSVQGARDRLEGPGPDVLVTDLGLGDGSGYDVIAAARHRDPSTPVVILSGQIDGLDGAIPAHIWVLSKPVDSVQLSETVDAAARGRRRRSTGTHAPLE
jgi:DNA-binding NtrC family response regulator